MSRPVRVDYRTKVAFAMANTSKLQDCLNQLQHGESAAGGELVAFASERLRQLTQKMLRRYPEVRRWEQTDDVLQNSLIRLHRALTNVSPVSVRHFFALAATLIRHELIDLARHYYGPHGLGANQASRALGKNAEKSGDYYLQVAANDDANEPVSLAEWSEFHEKVESLPEEEREVVSLLYYQGVTQTEAATLLGISERTVKRRWQSARLLLHEALNG